MLKRVYAAANVHFIILERWDMAMLGTICDNCTQKEKIGSKDDVIKESGEGLDERFTIDYMHFIR